MVYYFWLTALSARVSRAGRCSGDRRRRHVDRRCPVGGSRGRACYGSPSLFLRTCLRSASYDNVAGMKCLTGIRHTAPTYSRAYNNGAPAVMPRASWLMATMVSAGTSKMRRYWQIPQPHAAAARRGAHRRAARVRLRSRKYRAQMPRHP